jgi:hypothetical protein
MNAEDQSPPEVDTSDEKLAELAKAEQDGGVVDQQTASSVKPTSQPDE